MTVADETRLEGELVLLRPRVDDDLALFARWHGNPDVRHWLHMSEIPNQSLELERQRWQIARNDPTRVSFVIETLDGVPIGNIVLVGIDAAHVRAELGIAIGEKEHWGRGYGTDAIRVVLRFAFEVLNLRRGAEPAPGRADHRHRQRARHSRLREVRLRARGRAASQAAALR